jgi:hypothetical protein
VLSFSAAARAESTVLESPHPLSKSSVTNKQTYLIEYTILFRERINEDFTTKIETAEYNRFVPLSNPIFPQKVWKAKL